ncbi:caspase family protein [Pollutibacter soli]|uniref:caspase family protein n=1 Tax=Pollutibacter soli TaxID=3034157 RepID=UPI0030132294
MRAYSLHIGVNNVNPVHYNGWDGILACCENDAKFYSEVAGKAGITEQTLLLSSDADEYKRPLTANVNAYLKKQSETLKNGDFLFISYSGHGGQVKDINHDEDDFQDETWCLWDRQLIDDELWDHFSRFEAGVKILMVSDSCHSGSMSRGAGEETATVLPKRYVTREAPRDIGLEAYHNNKQDYADAVRMPLVIKDDIAASVLLLGACQDAEKAVEQDGFGLMTGALRKVLLENERPGTYKQVHSRIFDLISAIQRPNLFAYGRESALFREEEMFKIDPKKYFSFIRK